MLSLLERAGKTGEWVPFSSFDAGKKCPICILVDTAEFEAELFLCKSYVY